MLPVAGGSPGCLRKKESLVTGGCLGSSTAQACACIRKICFRWRATLSAESRRKRAFASETSASGGGRLSRSAADSPRVFTYDCTAHARVCHVSVPVPITMQKTRSANSFDDDAVLALTSFWTQVVTAVPRSLRRDGADGRVLGHAVGDAFCGQRSIKLTPQFVATKSVAPRPAERRRKRSWRRRRSRPEEDS